MQAKEVEMKSTKDRIRYALVSLMDERGTKGRELARAVGVKDQSVSGWRTGAASMTVDNMIAVCDYYGVTLDDFVGRDTGRGDADAENEARVLAMYRALDEDGRAVVLSMLEHMAK
jgi:transcriptional regulator with XRE-family HTH domain